MASVDGRYAPGPISELVTLKLYRMRAIETATGNYVYWWTDSLVMFPTTVVHSATIVAVFEKEFRF